MVGEELHTKDVVEFADAVKLYPFRVIYVQPFLLSYGIHGLGVEPPAEGRSQLFFPKRGYSWCIDIIWYCARLKNVLYIINCFHHIYLTHELFGMPVNTSHMASLPTKHKMTEVKRICCQVTIFLNKHYHIFLVCMFNSVL